MFVFQTKMTTLFELKVAGHRLELQLHRVEILKSLFEDGVLVNKVFPDGSTSLHRAVLYDHEELCKQLIDMGADIEALDSDLMTPLSIADDKRSLKALAVLIKAGAKLHYSRLGHGKHYVAKLFAENDYPAINVLLKSGVKLDEPLPDGTYPIHHIMAFDDHYKLNIREHAISCGMNLEVCDKAGCTPLLVAAKLNDQRCLELLIMAGVNLRARSRDNNSALTIICKQNDAACLKILLDADPECLAVQRDATEAMQNSIISYVKKYANTFDVLMRRDAPYDYTIAGRAAINHNRPKCLQQILARSQIYPLTLWNGSSSRFDMLSSITKCCFAFGVTGQDILERIDMFMYPAERYYFLVDAIYYGFITARQVKHATNDSRYESIYKYLEGLDQPTLVELCERRLRLQALRQRVMALNTT